MNADTATPAAPSPTPAQPLAPVPVPGATTPPAGDLGHHGHVHTEKNALLDWSKKAWEGLKQGKVGNPKVLLLVLAVAAILGAWWFLANSSKAADSALWYQSDTALNPAEGGDAAKKAERLNAFADEPSMKDSVAAPIAKLNAIRLRKTEALRKLNGEKLADRLAGADELEKVRDELAKAADWFLKDRTMKAAAFLDAAEAELALVGVPKKDAKPLDADDQKSRGQVAEYAKLLRSAADAIGPTTEAGKGFTAKVEKYADKDAVADLYKRLSTFHASFNNPDPTARPTDPTDPTDPFGGEPGGPKRPTTLPDGPTDKPLDPGEAPKPPTKPLDPPK